MVRHYILKNKSKVAIISSLFLHSLLFLSIQSDQSLGTTKTPIEFAEIKIISGPGESIKKKKFKQNKKESNSEKNITTKSIEGCEK